jgi:dTDP-4-dehydrorhamnose 3,5-epimerase
VRVISTAIPDVRVLMPCRRTDARGYFVEAYNKRTLAEAGIAAEFVQDNHNFSVRRGTVRGLHFQVPPFAQAKLIRVVRGAIFDVALDLRPASTTFGRHVTNVITAADGQQLFVPEGFAHGLCTLEPDTEVIFKITNFHSPAHERGILWSDPALGIPWPVTEDEAVVSVKDRAQPGWRELLEAAGSL